MQNLGDALPLLLLCHGQLGGQGADLLLRLKTFGNIGRENGNTTRILSGKLVDGKLDSDTILIGQLKTELSAGAGSGLRKELIKSTLVFRPNQISKLKPDELF